MHNAQKDAQDNPGFSVENLYLQSTFKSKNKAVAVTVDTKSPPSFTVFLLSNVVVLKLLK